MRSLAAWSANIGQIVVQRRTLPSFPPCKNMLLHQHVSISDAGTGEREVEMGTTLPKLPSIIAPLGLHPAQLQDSHSTKP